MVCPVFPKRFNFPGDFRNLKFSLDLLPQFGFEKAECFNCFIFVDYLVSVLPNVS